MHIDHIAIWTNDLDKLRDFYLRFFDCKASNRYDNDKKHFSSCFLSFASYDTRIEIMQRPDVADKVDSESIGLAHFAIGVGTKEQVDNLTKKLERAGITIDSYPRTTGDGYYESVIRDPENNKVELTAVV
jgi:lactoylglutathione lyase